MPEVPESLESISCAENDEDMKWMTDAAIMLSKRFNSVQILATKYDRKTGQTVNVVSGRGDWYARYGVTRAWIDAAEKDSTFNNKSTEEF